MHSPNVSNIDIALNQGERASRHLKDILSIDQYQLAQHCLPQPSQSTLDAIAQANKLGILQKMTAIGGALYQHYGLEQGLNTCQHHPSDTVRGWACFIIGADTSLDITTRLHYIQAFANDSHFGVREWAWLAIRPHLKQDLNNSLNLLSTWTNSDSEYIRRFASEALRPRGVWCSHINELKHNPNLGLIILEGLKADPSIYVQDSVSNWLNDASKTQADWVRQVCQRWQQESPHPQTARICKRALRSIDKKPARKCATA